MPVNPTSGGGAPVSATAAVRIAEAIGAPAGDSAASIQSRISVRRSNSGCSARRSSASVRNGRQHLLGVRTPRAAVRRSMSTTHRSGTTLGALPPSISAALTVARPQSGCTVSGTTSARRSRKRAIDVIAFTPRSGWEPWAAAPNVVAVTHAPPRWASADLQVARLAHDRRALCEQSSVAEHLRAVGAGEFLVGHQMELSDPASSIPARTTADAAASAAATGLSCRRRRGRSASRRRPPRERVDRPGVQRSRRHRVEVSVPGEGRTRIAPDRGQDARAVALPAHGLGGRRRAAGVPRSPRRPHRPRWCPGFSDRARMRACAVASTSSASTAAEAASARSVGIDADATGNRHRARPRSVRWMAMPDLGEALAPALDPAPAPRPEPGDRLAAVLAVLVGADDPLLLFTERAAMLSRHAGEISFPGGLQDPGDVDRGDRAARDARGARASIPRCGGARRVAVHPHARERHTRDAVRGHRARAPHVRRSVTPRSAGRDRPVAPSSSPWRRDGARARERRWRGWGT